MALAQNSGTTGTAELESYLVFQLISFGGCAQMLRGSRRDEANVGSSLCVSPRQLP